MNKYSVIIRTYADMLGEEWFFNGRLDDDDKRTNAKEFAKRLRECGPFSHVSEDRLYAVICEALGVNPKGDSANE